jgi:hypothetical protein
MHYATGKAPGTVDAATGLVKRAAGQAAVTSTGYIGTQRDEGGAAATDYTCVINVEAIDISSNDETYTFRVIGSNAADRSDGQILDMLQLGRAGIVNIETRNTAAGDQAIMQFRTMRNFTMFRYLDLHMQVAGTTPSITFNAYFTKGT